MIWFLYSRVTQVLTFNSCWRCWSSRDSLKTLWLSVMSCRAEPESWLMTQRLESFGFFWWLIDDSSQFQKTLVKRLMSIFIISRNLSKIHATYLKITQPLMSLLPEFITEWLVSHESVSFSLKLGKWLLMTRVICQWLELWLESQKKDSDSALIITSQVVCWHLTA